MIGWVSAAVELIKGVAGEYMTDWRAEKQNAREVKRAVTENRIRLAQSEQTHNHNWEMAALEGRDTLLRRVSFMLLTFPLLWAGFDPQGAGQYFTGALGALPDWYVQAYLGVLAAIWGLTELRKYRG